MKTILIAAAYVLLLTFVAACSEGPDDDGPVMPDEPIVVPEPEPEDSTGTIEPEEPINPEDTTKVEIIFNCGL